MTELDATLATSDCTVCTHPRAAEIDQALLSGTAIRTVAGTFDVSRSAIGRHKLNHLSVQAITEPGDSEPRDGLRLVDVHVQLTALADRLEHVVELATRTRKAAAATTAMRELRQTLEAIARIQADPDLKQAASGDSMRRAADEATGKFLAQMLDFLVREFVGLDPSGRGPDTSQINAVIVACLRVANDPHRATSGNPFANVDATPAREYRERHAMERARRMEAEVQNRVETELRRREAQQRPALEARQQLAIEGGDPVWTT